MTKTLHFAFSFVFMGLAMLSNGQSQKKLGLSPDHGIVSLGLSSSYFTEEQTSFGWFRTPVLGEISLAYQGPKGGIVEGAFEFTGSHLMGILRVGDQFTFDNNSFLIFKLGAGIGEGNYITEEYQYPETLWGYYYSYNYSLVFSGNCMVEYNPIKRKSILSFRPYAGFTIQNFVDAEERPTPKKFFKIGLRMYLSAGKRISRLDLHQDTF